MLPVEVLQTRIKGNLSLVESDHQCSKHPYPIPSLRTPPVLSPTADAKTVESTSRSNLKDEIREAVGDFVMALLEENASLNGSVSDLFRAAKDRLVAMDPEDTV